MKQLERVLFRLTGSKGRALKVLDTGAIYLLLLLAFQLLGVQPVSLLESGIVIFSYLLFLQGFEFYNYRRFDGDRVLYAVTLTILFSVLFSILIMVGLVFHPIGRKVMFVHSVWMFGYLLARGWWLKHLQQRVSNRFHMIGSESRDLPEDFMKRLSESGTVTMSEQVLEPAGTELCNHYYIVLDSSSLDESTIRELVRLKLKGEPVYSAVGFWEVFFHQVPIDHIHYSFFFDINRFHRANRLIFSSLKRVVDLIIAVLILVPALPLMALTAILIRLESEGPAVFRQQRTGMNGEPFVIFKFRSMRVDAERDGARWAVENDPRITRVGRVIRKLRIDELPQLFNVIRGDMSFIGPRPERPEFDEALRQEIPFYMFRYLVRPGLTGWAQINYGYGASVNDAREKLKYDLYYAKNYSFLLDMEIFIRTLRIVLFGMGR